MRTPYEDFSVSDNEEAKSAIPYHARENSLPFSYGQIGKTSTPLKSGASSGGSGVGGSVGVGSGSGIGIGGGRYRSSGNLGMDSDFNFNSDRHYGATNQYRYNYNNINNNSNNNYNSSSVNSGARNVAFGGSGTGMNAQPARLTSPLLVRKTLNSRSPTRNTSNTIANTYHYNYGHSSTAGIDDSRNNNSNTNGNSVYSSIAGLNGNSNYNSGGVRKTPVRTDFEELLRERREKVYNEYRSTMPSQSQSLQRPLPQPPIRQSSSDLAVRNAIENGQHLLRPSQPPYKYNYDFEFNLNLEDVPPPRRTRSSLQLQQYQTRNIPLEHETTPAYVERNYHTVASYGNGKASGYGYNEYNVNVNGNGNGNGSGVNRNVAATLGSMRGRNNDLSPIYATTTKQMTNSKSTSTSTSTAMYRGQTEPELSITDYPSAALGMASSASTLVSRPETPAFPVTPRTPYGTNHSYNSVTTPILGPSAQRPDHMNGQPAEVQNYSSETIYQTNYRPRLHSSMSLVNNEPQEVAAHLVKFAKDSSKFWYKPNLSREEAISLLLNAAPGTFVVRDSTTYKNAYGLVLRVAQPPPGSASGKLDELVRHFLIEPTTLGVRLKGCANEPVFTSLSALVYEHSVNQLALPCLLRIPEQDVVPPLMEPTPAQKQLMLQGAACNVLWLYSCDTESLTGEEAIRKAIRQLYALKSLPTPTEVHFKVAQQGITLTDNTRKIFFRKHYAADMISFCAVDPDHRLWTMQENGESGTATTVGALKKTIFAFVARRSPSSKDNQCHVFCDLAINQPASAIVSFVNKTLPTEKHKNYML